MPNKPGHTRRRCKRAPGHGALTLLWYLEEQAFVAGPTHFSDSVNVLIEAHADAAWESAVRLSGEFHQNGLLVSFRRWWA